MIEFKKNSGITINLNTDGTWAIFAGDTPGTTQVGTPDIGAPIQWMEQDAPRRLYHKTWKELKSLGKKASGVLRVGDFKNVTLKDGTNVQFRIIGFNHDVTASGQKAPISWEMVNCLPTAYPWNETDTNRGSWEATKIRWHLNDENGDIYRLIPDEILEVVTPVIKETATSDGTIIRTEDSFWIESERELFGRNVYSSPGEGRWYEYYRQERVPYWKNRNGDRYWTMLRSPASGNSDAFCDVYSSGYAGYLYASSDIGVAFGFCV